MGSRATAGLSLSTGDSAILVRYSTATRTSKNHPLYLYSYYHGVAANAANQGDTVAGAYVTSHQTYAAAWITGFSDGTLTLKRCGPNGDVATGSLVNSTIHHRDFPS